MLKKNDIFDAVIEADAGNGSGICRVDDIAVFAGGTTRGDKAKIKIVNVKSSYALAEVLEILEPSENRNDGFCASSAICGGCDFAHIKYERQLEIKKEHVLSCLERIGKISKENFEYFDTLGIKKPFEYRNKMVFPVGYDKKRRIIGGFYKRGTHDIAELKTCAQGPKEASLFLNAVLEYMREENVSCYDEKTHKGLVRRVFVRFGFYSKEAMVVISVNGNKLPKAEKLIEKILSEEQNEFSVKSIILNVNKQKNNLVLGNDNLTLFGRDYIYDSICGINYKISPNSFFQVNPVQTEVLYNKAMEFAELKGDETVIDLYCGIGTISLMAAKYAKSVVGVEIVEQAIKDAKNNAIDNGIKNAEFIAGSAETISFELAKSGKKADVIFIDPPRKGSDEKTLDCIAEMSPEKIVYISCNPATLARDLAYLKTKGYKTKKVQPVDMFPNTGHCEVVCALQRQPRSDINS